MYSGSNKAPKIGALKLRYGFYRYTPVLIDDDYFVNFST